MKTKWYTFTQNNSGGGYIITEELNKLVIIEATSHEHANERAESVGIYFKGCEFGRDCPCCGNRWDEASDWEGDEVPMFGRTTLDLESKEDMECIVIHPLKK